MTLGHVRAGLAVLAAVVLAACGDSNDGQAGGDSTLTLYTCANEATVGAVIDGFTEQNPEAEVELFRAPTGQLNARVASDARTGGLAADVVWACDPLTMQAYVDQGIVGGWTPDAPGVPDEFRTSDYIGAHVLHVIAVYHQDVTAPATWWDLTEPVYRDAVVLPDPGFAASALGAVGYFTADADHGEAYLEALRANGAVKVSTPDDVTTGVAQGVYDVGISIATSAYPAQVDGSPIEIAWPEPGAVAVYGPVAVATGTDRESLAQSFATYVLSEEGQQAIADTGSYPTMTGITGPIGPEGAPVVSPDWSALAEEQEQVLATFTSQFGG